MMSYQLSVISYQLNEPMREHTTFRVGGPADVFVEPVDENELLGVLRECRERGYPHFILGNGSNLLVRDGGIRGVVISLLKMTGIRRLDGGEIEAEAGVLMKDLAEFARLHGLAGLEFLHGIPGSVGGGVFMNAGAYEREMADIFVSARCISKSNEVIDISFSDMSFSYRKSMAQTEGHVVVSAILQGRAGDAVEIGTKMQDLGDLRSAKQPLESPSAGSIFKRPPGKFAGKLIADAGLRGHIIGGAQVSEKHCGFIINRGKATAADILSLIEHIQNTVQDKFGIWLETEVKIIGE
ncbi:MAG: UDP-N-acetylmuramate dehydrogenase [Clostridiales bacterium]|jgi:UDP-N-acetylmuramate dehydrogenase|nr:UDP-N-acetylmuramate dehydrogenase [Clostridiales bacterium]